MVTRISQEHNGLPLKVTLSYVSIMTIHIMKRENLKWLSQIITFFYIHKKKVLDS